MTWRYEACDAPKDKERVSEVELGYALIRAGIMSVAGTPVDVIVTVGNGVVVSGTFSGINWGSGSKFCMC